MNISRLLAALLVAAVMTTGAVQAAGLDVYADADPQRGDRGERGERERDLYEEGTDAIGEEEWEKAVDYFTRVAEMKGGRTDGALYWTAYALNRLNRRVEALKTIDALKKNHPKSRWISDANALEVEVRQSSGERVRPEQVDDDVKVMAIQSLMHSDPEKAFPLLEKIVKGGSYSKKMKEQALFVLSQSRSPRAQQLLASIAKGNSNPDIQEEAIRYLGISGGSRNAQLLSEIYDSNVSQDVKEKVLKAFMISGQKARVHDAAKNEKNADLREKAIHLLGVMGGRAELSQMYAAETSRNMKEEIIKALFIAGDSGKIGELATNEKDPELRAEAIRKLGLMGKKTAPTLLNLYATGDAKVKDAVIHGLFVQGNAKALIQLARNEKDRQLKREILQKLSVMRNDDAVAYMLEILGE